MNYILVMSLSGSVMLLLYFFQKHTFGKNLSKGWQYLFLKAVMVYYLMPLPWLGTFYRKIVKDIRQAPPQFYFQYLRNDKVVYQAENNFLISVGYQRRLLTVGVWCLMAFLVFSIRFVWYRKTYRGILWHGKGEDAGGGKVFLDRKKKEWRIRRKITFCSCDSENMAFTMGIRNPVIVCKMPKDSMEREMLLTHELVHIKRFDLVWKIAGTIMLAMHWFNPLAYLFQKEFEKVTEESCDEQVIKEYSEEERLRYALMLVKRSAGQNGSMGWRTELSKNAQRIRERAELIMDCRKRKNKWSGLLAVLLTCGMVILNSVTAMAYEEVKVLKVREEEKMANIQTLNVETCFTPYEYEGENLWTDTILYEKQFEDEEGNIYPVKEEGIPYMDCNHTFISGTYKEHEKNDDGGCYMTYYESQYCKKCGYCIIREQVGFSSFVRCIH